MKLGEVGLLADRDRDDSTLVLYTGTCPFCGYRAITSSHSNVVTCNKCGNGFGIEIPQPH